MCSVYLKLVSFFFLSPPFSIDKLIESAEIMSGVNNIYNCTTSSGHREMNRKVAGNKSYIRNIQIDIKRGHPMMLNLQPRMADKLEFWEIHFKSHSYIYKQVHVIEGGFLYNVMKVSSLCIISVFYLELVLQDSYIIHV